jgi:hypothetical protein
MSDAEIEKMVASARATLARVLSSPKGKVARFIVTSAVGLIPGGFAAASLATGAIDSFLIEKVLPRSGICAFLTDTYPSLFHSS